MIAALIVANIVQMAALTLVVARQLRVDARLAALEHP